MKRFNKEVRNENDAVELLQSVISSAREAIDVIAEAFRKPWSANPTTSERAVFGHWLVYAVRHLVAIIILCEERDLSMVANVHRRQMFEIFLQVRYYASVQKDKRENLAEKISAWGCIEYLEKLESLKDHDDVKNGYDYVLEQLTHHNQNTIDEIKSERERRIFNWFGRSFSKLAVDVSKEGEDLRGAYQLISADLHGTWRLALDVANPQPGILDFRGYPDKTTMYRWAADLLDQSTILYVNTWNEVAVVLGAPEVYLE